MTTVWWLGIGLALVIIAIYQLFDVKIRYDGLEDYTEQWKRFKRAYLREDS